MPALVIACAGQSNMAGRGTSAQSFSPPELDATVWNGSAWVALTDSAYGANLGSFVPLLATALAQSVGFIPGAVGGTSITTWLPGQSNYENLKTEITQTGLPCDVWLWWQGETDEQAAMSQATYNAHLDTLANGVFSDFGCQLMPCKLQNYGAGATWTAINAAIATAWGDNANVATGPDFSDLSTAAPQGDDSFHLVSTAVLQTVATRWNVKLLAAGIGVVTARLPWARA